MKGLLNIGALGAMMAAAGDKYPTMARQIFTSGRRNVKNNKTTPFLGKEYHKPGIPVKNPKVAANIQMMHEKWLANKKK